ncbi:MAG: alanine--tRNA ligase, partial [Gemmatimonadetes bacterium]|nr:alanine--tRNA ligase [Gemmatimonadota bacterium]
AEGTMNPLPAPSIDTGAGLERLAAVMQGVDSNFHTDLFVPLLERAAEVLGRPYEAGTAEGVAFRVLADHARAVAFLLADGVFPSNEGRGYVLRRILRRAVRHAWMMGRREPTLVHVVDAVADTMADVFPEVAQRRDHLVRTTRAEEERFLATIEGGLDRFDELAPREATGTIPGEEAFRLYDTFGFPLDLTELMAEERGWDVDSVGFEVALEAQRERSRADRAAAGRAGHDEGDGDAEWSVLVDGGQRFVGYDGTAVDTEVLAVMPGSGRVGLVLRDNPFYLESGGQVSDRGEVAGAGWCVRVDEVRRVSDRSAVFGTLEGGLPAAPGPVSARVDRSVRHDTERNHTATHLLHAALREILGGHVVQRGSLVAPDRLRFDFAHTAPMTPDELVRVEARVNEGIWRDHSIVIGEMEHSEAVARGAMALFGEKYGDRVRVVEIPDVSMELCGGTHVRHTGEIGLFKLVSESGVAAGVRRIEAQTGPGAFRYMQRAEDRLAEVARTLKTPPENAPRRAEQVLEERAELESLLDELRKGGGGGEEVVASVEFEGPSGPLRLKAVRIRARDADDARAWGDAFLQSGPGGVAVVAAELPGDKHSLFTFVTDDLIGSGVRADAVVREIAAVAGGRGGGRPHMAQAGVGDPGKVQEALEQAEAVVRRLVGAS